METPEQKIARVTKEEVALAPYDPRWPEAFEEERRHLLSCLPKNLIKRIEHFGSTAVPGLPAKPIVDMLVWGACFTGMRRDALQTEAGPIAAATPDMKTVAEAVFVCSICQKEAGHG